MKFKKIVALGLAVAMSVTMLSGCGSAEEKSSAASSSDSQQSDTASQSSQSSTSDAASSSTEESKKVTFPLEETLIVTAMGVQPKSEYSYDDNIAWQYVQELTNIKFEMNGFVTAEAAEKMNLLMSSGDYPEVLYKASPIDVDKYGMDGILIPLEDLIREYAPNLTAMLDERNAWGAITASDGHIYSLPSFAATNARSNTSYAYWINTEWLDKVGMEMPASRDDLYEVLKAFKEKDPNGNGEQDEIPWVIQGATGANRMHNILGWFGEGLYYGEYWMVKDGQLEYLPTTEYFKEDFLKYMKKLYDEGLINEDAFTLTQEQMEAVGKSGANVYGMFGNSSAVVVGSDYEVRKYWKSLKPFDTDNFALDQGISTEGLAITDKCENPEIIIQWADFFYTEEGGRVLRMGVEGKSYELSADGKTYVTLQEGFDSVTYQATLMGGATVPGIIPGIYYTGQDPVNSAVSAFSNNEMYGEDYGVFTKGVICPTIIYTVEEKETIEGITIDVGNYVSNYVAETITGLKAIDDTWEEFQSTLKAMGVEELIKVRRTAYERAISAE